jgi:hypothetical protein
LAPFIQLDSAHAGHTTRDDSRVSETANQTESPATNPASTQIKVNPDHRAEVVEILEFANVKNSS